ncbi:MAG TPA: mechanosensitive ion channel family protein [Candidatus Polarisedimenticolaceae bacterium]|nr:mechanosensitive ion channel family protein [Candidatus Polarisedimenticolaceae bacterium]
MIVCALLIAVAASAPPATPAPSESPRIFHHLVEGELPAVGSPRAALYAFLNDARRPDYLAAASHLDLRDIPPDERAVEGPELARHLKVVLDRNIWFDLNKVSNRPEGNTADGLPQDVESIGSIHAVGALVDVVMVRQASATGELTWRFSPSLVAKIPALYEEFGFGWVGDHAPGWMHRMGPLGLELWQLLGFLVLLIGGWFVSHAATNSLTGLLRPIVNRTRAAFDDRLLESMYRPFRFTLWTILLAIGVHLLHISVRAAVWIDRFLLAFAFVAAVRIVAGFSEAWARAAQQRLEREGHRSGAGVVNVINRVVKALLGCIAIIGLLQAFGFNVTGLLAGLGIGGVAIALAAQKTIENLFGGLTVMADKPVRIGDFCRFGDKSGWVEDIGFRSTRIRTLDRTILSVPNSEFSTVQIENLAERDRMRLFATLGLRYETSPDQLRAVLASLRKILIGHPKVNADQLRVRFTSFSASSLDVEVNAYVMTNDASEFQAIREDLFLRFMEAVRDAGTGFAFPSQTVYLSRDRGLDAGKTRAAETSIQVLRAESKLPFPEFAPDEIRELTDRLDYPPEGSSGAIPPVTAS